MKSLKIVNGSSHSFDSEHASETRLVKFKSLETFKQVPVFVLQRSPCSSEPPRLYVSMVVNKNSRIETFISGPSHCIVTINQSEDSGGKNNYITWICLLFIEFIFFEKFIAGSSFWRLCMK